MVRSTFKILYFYFTSLWVNWLLYCLYGIVGVPHWKMICFWIKFIFYFMNMWSIVWWSTYTFFWGSKK